MFSGLVLDPVVATVAFAATAIVTLIGALPKLTGQPAFRETVAGFRLLPHALVASVAVAIPVVEIVAALACLIPATRTAGAAALVALFGLFAIALAVNVARGHTDIDCGCSGFARADRPVPHAIGWAHVGRTLLLVVLAALAGVPQSARSIVWFDYLSVFGGTLLALATQLTLDVLLANRPKLNQLRNS